MHFYIPDLGKCRVLEAPWPICYLFLESQHTRATLYMYVLAFNAKKEPHDLYDPE